LSSPLIEEEILILRRKNKMRGEEIARLRTVITGLMIETHNRWHTDPATGDPIGGGYWPGVRACKRFPCDTAQFLEPMKDETE
jgi:hypothetical protein